MLSLEKSLLLLTMSCFWYNFTNAETSEDLQVCQSHLDKYQSFLIQAVLKLDNICNTYNLLIPTTLATLSNGLSPNVELFGPFPPRRQHTEEWSLLKLLMAQFDDLDFINTIRNAVIERCRNRYREEQRDEKRNSVILGKKQRFHSWGGKRNDVSSESILNKNNNNIPWGRLFNFE